MIIVNHNRNCIFTKSAASPTFEVRTGLPIDVYSANLVGAATSVAIWKGLGKINTSHAE